MWLALVFLLQQGRMIALDAPLSGLLTDASETSPLGHHAEFFSFRCSARLAIRIEVASDWDNVVFVSDASGRVLSRDDDSGGGTDARLDWTCPDARVYRFGVTAYHDATGGAFTIRVNDLNDAASSTRRFPLAMRVLNPDDAAQGSLGAGAERYEGHPVVFYGFQCRPGLIVRMDLGSDFDNMLFVVGPSGTAASNDDANGTDASLTFTCPDAGAYRIGAGAHGTQDTGAYRLYLRKMS